MVVGPKRKFMVKQWDIIRGEYSRYVAEFESLEEANDSIEYFGHVEEIPAQTKEGQCSSTA